MAQHSMELQLTAQRELHSEKHAVTMPTYVRVNTWSTSVSEVVARFRDEGWKLLCSKLARDYQDYRQTVAYLHEREFCLDYHIPELLVFPAGLKLQLERHVLCAQGDIVIKDKGSLLPVFLLDPPPGAVTLDMCAGRGVNAIHITSKQTNQGRVCAVEKDHNVFQRLCKAVKYFGATCVTPILGDVLAVQDGDVEFILLDPPCSRYGNPKVTKGGHSPVQRKGPTFIRGIPGKVEHAFYEEHYLLTNEKLISQQIAILRHALSGFPKARRIVYTTESLNREENEEVLEKALGEGCCGFKLASVPLQGSWDNWGGDGFEMCLYARLEHDLTGCRFVAVLERTEEAMAQHRMEAGLTTEQELQGGSHGKKCTKQESKEREHEVSNGYVKEKMSKKRKINKQETKESVKHNKLKKRKGHEEEAIEVSGTRVDVVRQKVKKCKRIEQGTIDESESMVGIKQKISKKNKRNKQETNESVKHNKLKKCKGHKEEAIEVSGTIIDVVRQKVKKCKRIEQGPIDESESMVGIKQKISKKHKRNKQETKGSENMLGIKQKKLKVHKGNEEEPVGVSRTIAIVQQKKLKRDKRLSKKQL